jgi:hypothetical protein
MSVFLRCDGGTLWLGFVHLRAFFDANMWSLVSCTGGRGCLCLDVHVTHSRAKTRTGRTVLATSVVLGVRGVNHLREILRFARHASIGFCNINVVGR